MCRIWTSDRKRSRVGCDQSTVYDLCKWYACTGTGCKSQRNYPCRTGKSRNTVQNYSLCFYRRPEFQPEAGFKIKSSGQKNREVFLWSFCSIRNSTSVKSRWQSVYYYYSGFKWFSESSGYEKRRLNGILREPGKRTGIYYKRILWETLWQRTGTGCLLRRSYTYWLCMVMDIKGNRRQIREKFFNGIKSDERISGIYFHVQPASAV